VFDMILLVRPHGWSPHPRPCRGARLDL